MLSESYQIQVLKGACRLVGRQDTTEILTTKKKERKKEREGGREGGRKRKFHLDNVRCGLIIHAQHQEPSTLSVRYKLAQL